MKPSSLFLLLHIKILTTSQKDISDLHPSRVPQRQNRKKQESNKEGETITTRSQKDTCVLRRNNSSLSKVLAATGRLMKKNTHKKDKRKGKKQKRRRPREYCSVHHFRRHRHDHNGVVEKATVMGSFSQYPVG